MRFAVMALLGAAMVAGSAAGHGQDGDGMDLWAGSCSADSHTADGKVRTLYPCNAVLHMALPGDPGHEMLIFVIKGDAGKQNGVMLSFGGRIDAKGNLQVERIQFTPAVATPMAVGSECVITRAGAAFKRIRCSATASDGSGRSAAIDFTVTGKTEIKGQG